MHECAGETRKSGGRIVEMMFSKHDVLNTFENPRAKHFSLVNDIFACATVVSILAIILETVPSLMQYERTFFFIEWATVVLFGFEYGIRLWASRSRKKYAFSFFGIIDLLAILPSFLGIGNLTYLKSARVLRIIRFLRIIRLSQITKLKVADAEETLGIFGFNIALYAFTLISVTLLFGALLHVLDTEDGRYWSIPEGMYWTFSVFLGGLPTPIPPGTIGTVIYILAKFCGMALFGLLIGVVGKLFNEWILGKG